VHAAILKINQALEAEEPTEVIVKLMKNPVTQLKNVTPDNGEQYRDTLIAAKVRETFFWVTPLCPCLLHIYQLTTRDYHFFYILNGKQKQKRA
jgi:hypothetical protein